MDWWRWSKPGFAVIGLEGSTEDGEGFVARLWEEANRRFPEVEALAKRKEDGLLAGVWGAMTDMERTFQPWENGFQRGRYLAGVECRDDAEPPEGWTRWDVPGFEYFVMPNDRPDAFRGARNVFICEGFTLAGAVQELMNPGKDEKLLCFPIRRLDE